MPNGERFEPLKMSLEDTPLSAMLDRPDDAQKIVICQLIDKTAEQGAAFQNDWDSEDYTADQANRYLTNYGKLAV